MQSAGMPPYTFPIMPFPDFMSPSRLPVCYSLETSATDEAVLIELDEALSIIFYLLSWSTQVP